MSDSFAKKLMSFTVSKFLMVGVINTIVGALVMLVLYNKAGWGYWLSSGTSYFIGSVVSFILNRNFTFHNHDPIIKTVPKFALNILICYLLAYLIAKPAMIYILRESAQISNVKLVENLAMMFGMVLFTTFNYLGQRFFAFRKSKTVE